MCTAKYSSKKELTDGLVTVCRVRVVGGVSHRRWPRLGQGVRAPGAAGADRRRGAPSIGAARYERTEARTTERNGARAKVITTHAGDVAWRMPKLRAGASFFPSILSPRRRIDHALHAVVMEAYVHGVSTRRVDDLVVALGGSGISKSEVSRICAGLDEAVGAFRTRRLDHTEFPYVYLDATYLHVRTEHAMVVSKAVVVATGVTADGRREVLGLDVGDSEDEVFWRGFLTALKKRGLCRGAAGDLRPARRPGRRHRPHHARQHASTLPGPLHPQRPGPRGQGRSRDGRRGVPHDLRPTRPGLDEQAVGQGPRRPRRPLPQGRCR